MAAGGGPAAVVSSLKKPGKQLQVPDFFKTDSKRRTLKLKLLDRQTGSAFRIVQRVPPFSYSIFQKCY